MTNHQRSRYRAVIPGFCFVEEIKYRHLYRQGLLQTVALEHLSTFGDTQTHVDLKVKPRALSFSARIAQVRAR